MVRMRFASPLRYPGGKASLTGVLSEIRRLNALRDYAVAEPFAGGAGASLSLLYCGETPKIHINDLDPAIHAFWQSAVYDTEALLSLLDERPVSVDEWKRQRDIYRTGGTSRLEVGFAAFYLNRCNRSGIIKNGGVIGGLDQGGQWKIGARFTKPTLRKRLERVAARREEISVTGLDGIKFIETLDQASTMYFIDPPYYGKGSRLYLNVPLPDYHERLAAKLRGMGDLAVWVLTYDDCPEVRELYEAWANVQSFSLSYSASERRQGEEILITPKPLRTPLPLSLATATVV